MPKFTDRLAHAWNAFMNKDPTKMYKDLGPSATRRPDRLLIGRYNGSERTIINAVYNRIAVDCSQIDIKHVRLDEKGRFSDEIMSGLNECLTVEANIDQTARAFLIDAVTSMLDEGVVALVPLETNVNPMTGSFDIKTMRTGKILEWYPQHIKVRIYNEIVGKNEELIVAKKAAAIIENPFYTVMNGPNSTLQRLIRKLSLMDIIDEKNGSDKLDLIIQLPYQIKTDLRRQQADERLQSIKDQLSSSDMGIAYTDGTEHITQLNRSIENQLPSQVEYLTRMLYSQLSITEEILNGTADEKAMNNYMNRTVEPIMNAIVDELKRKFLTKTARTQGQSVMYFRNMFSIMPVTSMAEIADKFTRNEILTSNEIRQIIGLEPNDDPRADELRNSNMPVQDLGMEPQEEEEYPEEEPYEEYPEEYDEEY